MYTQEFIEKANQIHHHKYDYSKTVYINSRTKIQFECPIHGSVEQNPKAHLKSCGCPSCASNKMITKEFIEKANQIHQHKYDYSKTVYVNQRNKLIVVCKIHGPFTQLARAHLAGQGCPQCSLQSPNRYKKDLNHFLKLARKIHRDKYDYSKTEYLSANKSLTIVCPIHGEFKQRASAHTAGQGCPKCNNHNKITKKEFISRANKIHNNKYDYSKLSYKSLNHKIKIICPIHGEFKQKASAHIINKNGCPQCGYQSMKSNLLYTNEKFTQLAAQKHNHKYDYSKTCYNNSKEKIIITCSKHGDFHQTPNDHLNGNGCPKCAGTHLQNEVFDFVTSFQIGVDYNNKKAIKPYEIDIFIPDKKIGIEINGLYWHSFDRAESTEEKYRHFKKCDICIQNNIKLLQINENEWNNQKEIIKSIIKSKLGLSKKVHARKCEILELNNQQYKEFCVKNHLQGYKTSSIKYGLIYQNELMSIISFNRHPKYQWEITRFANRLGYTVVGGASKLFKHFCNKIKPQTIITYADRRYSDGNLYRKLGFELNGITKPNYCYIKREKIFSRQQFQKHKLKDKLEIFNPNFTEAENMFTNNYRRLWDAGHFRFLFFK